MEQLFKIARKPTAKPGCPSYQVVDRDGGKPSGAALHALAAELAWLAQDTLDREAAIRLKPGMYYGYPRGERTLYVKYVGVDELGVQCIFVDKKGHPIDAGAGVGAVTYLQHSPVSELTLIKEQPVFAAVA